MKLDLSVPVTTEMLNTIMKLNATWNTSQIAAFGHIGTHFDVMDKVFQLENTERKGRLFDVSHIKDRDIEVTDIDVSRIEECDFVIFHTGWLREKNYGSPEYFENHPQLSNDLITYLINKKISMIGIDAAGIRNKSEHMRADAYCADNGIFVIENLNNLDTLLKEAGLRDFTVHTYPVNYQGITGLPCRVIARDGS